MDATLAPRRWDTQFRRAVDHDCSSPICTCYDERGVRRSGGYKESGLGTVEHWLAMGTCFTSFSPSSLPFIPRIDSVLARHGFSVEYRALFLARAFGLDLWTGVITEFSSNGFSLSWSAGRGPRRGLGLSALLSRGDVTRRQLRSRRSFSFSLRSLASSLQNSNGRSYLGQTHHLQLECSVAAHQRDVVVLERVRFLRHLLERTFELGHIGLQVRHVVLLFH